MELVNTLFASLVGTDPFTGVDITIANCKSAYWDEGIVQQLINQALDEGEKFVGAIPLIASSFIFLSAFICVA
jgi:hypothetical protein